MNPVWYGGGAVLCFGVGWAGLSIVAGLGEGRSFLRELK